MRSLMKWALDWPAFAQAGDEDDRENRDAKQLGDGFRARRSPFGSREIVLRQIRGRTRSWVGYVTGSTLYVAPLDLYQDDSLPIAMCASERVANTSAVSRCQVIIRSPLGIGRSSQ